MILREREKNPGGGGGVVRVGKMCVEWRVCRCLAARTNDDFCFFLNKVCFSRMLHIR